MNQNNMSDDVVGSVISSATSGLASSVRALTAGVLKIALFCGFLGLIGFVGYWLIQLGLCLILGKPLGINGLIGLSVSVLAVFLFVVSTARK